MKAIMVMYDSLNLRCLQPYGGDCPTPNFVRLAERAVRFDNCYVGSMPCMPARRELHTGRYNFLHRSWGPIEPFDDSMPEILKNNGVHSRLISDHAHYWEDGGATYHTRYSSWDAVRGQEGDPWQPDLGFAAEKADFFNSPFKDFSVIQQYDRQDKKNRSCMPTVEDLPMYRTFAGGIEFLDEYHQEDNWFLQIETFDPHEPFYTADAYPDCAQEKNGGDWPPYDRVHESEEQVSQTRQSYENLVKLCDYNLGKVLDKMDAYNLWEDTLLIVNTDHGYLLGEHGWWSKTVMPVYDEIAHTPLFIAAPHMHCGGEVRRSLVQTVDLAPTILEYFGLPIPPDMQGKALFGVVKNDTPVREYAFYGYHGAHINATDGKHVYMRAPRTPGNSPLYEYTLMPTHMRNLFSPEECKNLTLQPAFAFTKHCPTLKIPAKGGANTYHYGNKLLCTENPFGELVELANTEIELRFVNAIRQFILDSDGPLEQFERMGIPHNREMRAADLEGQDAERQAYLQPPFLTEHDWSREAVLQMRCLLQLSPEEKRQAIEEGFGQVATATGENTVCGQQVVDFAGSLLKGDQRTMVLYILSLHSSTA